MSIPFVDGVNETDDIMREHFQRHFIDLSDISLAIGVQKFWSPSDYARL
jgi:hypothetical protein